MEDEIISILRQGLLPKEKHIKSLCEKAAEIISRDDNVVKMNAPVTIVGDIHGQFYDMLEIFHLAGDIPFTSYLFLGDIVDRGYHSIECVLYLLACKVKHPDRIQILRGNHETRFQTQNYGFYNECLQKFGNLNVWNYCMEVFDYLPIVCIVENEIFGVHGGLSPSINMVQDIERQIDRIGEPKFTGAMADLLWSDPDEDLEKGWAKNPRGAGFLFAGDVVKMFCHVNKLKTIVRSHQLVMDGYKYMFDDHLICVWSAPNYCYRSGNIAAVLHVDEILCKQMMLFDTSPETEANMRSDKNLFFV